jgi:hypothetical protein
MDVILHRIRISVSAQSLLYDNPHIPKRVRLLYCREHDMIYIFNPTQLAVDILPSDFFF